MIVLEYILLVGVIVCAIAAPLCKRLLASVIVYMALSLMMAVLWSLLQSPERPPRFYTAGHCLQNARLDYSDWRTAPYPHDAPAQIL